MSLAEEIARARACFDNPPSNERNTCHWVIVPLLESMGYSRYEIVAEEPARGGRCPDYAILSGTANSWFLEVRPWTDDLAEDADLTAVLQFAEAARRRWLVLTNGREWRLYDCQSPDTPAAGRRMARARLELENEVRRFLVACSRASVVTGGLELYAVDRRMRRVLADQLVREDGDVVQAICGALRRQGLDARPADVVAYFAARQRPAALPTAEQAQRTPEPTPELAAEPARAPGPVLQLGRELEPPRDRTTQVRDISVTAAAGGAELYGGQTLQQWLQAITTRGRQVVAGWHPSLVVFPDGSRVSVSLWKDLAVECVRWAAESGHLPATPYRASDRGRKLFISSNPYQSDPNDHVRYAELRLGNRTLFVDTCRSADQFVQTVCRMFRDGDVDPATVTVVVQ